MKIHLEKLGALKQADFCLGDMTILCGGNNTGKTYATYALFGFLTVWRENFSIRIADKVIDQLFSDGVVHLDISEYSRKAASILADGCVAYTRQLPEIFAAPPDRFKESRFSVHFEPEDFHAQGKYERIMGAASTELFSIVKIENSNDLVITLLVDKEKVRIPPEVIKRIIGDALKDVVFGHLFPNPFIASAERTGAAIFRKDLNFARNRLLEEMTQTDKNVDPMDLLFKVYQDYALPVKVNVDFTRQLETLAKKSSFIADQHPDVLVEFADIIGGEYTVTRNDELYYIPKGKRVKLTMDESSSAVRSLLDVGFYLKHIVKRGDLLIVDEPELNLHPENQRRVARLFARLVNLGIKVFVTTHSDYIVKEINTLIMLNHDKPHLKQIAQEEGYKSEELISHDKIRVYIAGEALIRLDGGKKKTRCQTLTPADIDPEMGIEARSFDETIEAMNRVQERIVWGGE